MENINFDDLNDEDEDIPLDMFIDNEQQMTNLQMFNHSIYS
jgi:hypothetical protein